MLTAGPGSSPGPSLREKCLEKLSWEPSKQYPYDIPKQPHLEPHNLKE